MSSGKIFNGQTSERSKQKHCNTSIKRRDIIDEHPLKGEILQMRKVCVCT